MGLEKIGLNLGKEIIAFTRTGGKSMLATRPVKVNITELKYTPDLKADTFVKKVETWYDPVGHVTPYTKEGKTIVEGHHYFHGANNFYNRTLESKLKKIEHFKNENPRKYKELYDDRVAFYNEQTERLLEDNVAFTRLTPQPRDCVAYRGVNRYIGDPRQDFDVINSANVGDTIVPTRGFAYGAHHKVGTYQYLGSPYNYEGKLKFEPMLIEYRIPKGSQISSNMEHGGEVVFPALSKYKLLSKETRLIEELDRRSGNVIGSYPYKHVVLEYIPEIPLLT